MVRGEEGVGFNRPDGGEFPHPPRARRTKLQGHSENERVREVGSSSALKRRTIGCGERC